MDGVITLQELKEYLYSVQRSRSYLTQAEIKLKAMIDAADANADDMLTEDELLTIINPADTNGM